MRHTLITSVIARFGAPPLALLVLGLFALACGGSIETGPPGDQDNPWDNTLPPPPAANEPPLCKSDDAPSIFSNALCLCGDLKETGVLLVKNGVTTDPASFGVNGHVSAVAQVEVDGSMAAHSGLVAFANIEVQGSFWSTGDVNITGRLDVGNNMMVGGNVFGIGVLSVGGTLGVAGNDLILGDKSAEDEGPYEGLAAPPCPCGADQVLDVAAKVSAARTANDNGAVGLPASPVSTIGVTRLVLNSGRYYFASKAGIGYTKIVANGAVSIFIDDDYEAIGYDTFEVTEGSSLDVYVAGNIKTVGNMVLGSRHHPSAFRIYIGGSEDITVQVGNNIFRGSIYAPRASLTWIGNTRVEGSLFANTVVSAGLLELYFARPTTGSDGEVCTPPGGSAPPPPEPDDPPPPKDVPRVL
ncbi:MAG: hypothetical protein JRH20_04005 [Deltaproteobacteria bacterium]|nr:hypothetical protein [Deltaproteobacteria bacterium]